LAPWEVPKTARIGSPVPSRHHISAEPRYDSTRSRQTHRHRDRSCQPAPKLSQALSSSACPPGFRWAPATGRSKAGCRVAPVAVGRRGRLRVAARSRNCPPYCRTMAIAGCRRIPTPPRSSTKALSEAMRRTTSSAVSLGGFCGVSSGMITDCQCPGALSKASRFVATFDSAFGAARATVSRGAIPKFGG